MNRFRCALAPVLLFATLSLAVADAPQDAPATTTEVDGSAVRDAISKAWRDHIDAAIRKDLDTVVDIYADDIVYVVAGSPEIRGRETMTTMEARTLAEFDVVSAEHTSDAMRAFGNVAYELGTVIGPIRPKDGEPRTVTFHFMAMWRRQADGAWRIAHMVGGPAEE